MPPEQMQKSIVAQKEEEILSFWNTHNIFKKTLEKKSPKGDFVFYDGPPFATGLPHYGHLLASTIKDVIPRYKTMRGYHVRRQWGWDCHGLPIENLVESELGLEHKKDIEKFGIEKFNEAAKNSVLRYDSEWKKIIPRIGRWVDMENDYRTMDSDYTESIWWAFKTLYDKGLLYEGYKSMHICPRCETTLAVSEVGMGYKDITDISVTVKFKLEDEPNTFLLVWTTTPWTLPGNVALAVNKNFDYVKIVIRNQEPIKPSELTEGQTGIKNFYIIAKERLLTIKDEYEIVEEFKGSEIVGRKYKPLFPHYADALILKNRENGWKIYPAEFVSAEDGTGVVHIAPAFGENDMDLGTKYNLPFVQHVSWGGVFKNEVKDFAGFPVKPKYDHQATDVKIIQHLAHRGFLFSKEKITHAYPHCWRCDTPLLNYAASSWFVKVTALKEKLLVANKKIKWIPDSMRLGRFGKWLEGARDWAISRLRFWGAPLPVWKCESCKQVEVIGGVDDLKKKIITSGNRYFIMRHAESENNAQNIVSSDVEARYGLTEKGKRSAKSAAHALRNKKIDVIISSPILRTLETARIAANALGIDEKNIAIEPRITEVGVGEFNGKSHEEYQAYFSSRIERFTRRPERGENLLDVKKRVGAFLNETEEKYKNKNILLVTHADTAWQFTSAMLGWNEERAIGVRKSGEDFIKNAEVRELLSSGLPKNADHELDFHRPFIDAVKLSCRCGGTMARIEEVFDCWFESGSMPFAQFHHPFENSKLFNKNFPAHFIAEGLDQTRGWFYTMLVLSVGLFKKSAFNAVIVNGLILAEDGQKMSKKLKNYPDPVSVINSYGADALRYYLLSSPVVRGEDLNFFEKDLKEVMNKIVARLRNVTAFYELYRKEKEFKKEAGGVSHSSHVLDRWIRIRLFETTNKVTYAMEHYELDKAVRPIGGFIEDLSVWYIRRSRDRFKEEGQSSHDALSTVRYVLLELSKIIAPFMPFLAEEIYAIVEDRGKDGSVHMASWPKGEASIPVWPNAMALLHRLFGTHEDLRVLSDMERVREIVSLALEVRQKAGIKVRQPLNALRIKNSSARLRTSQELVQLIKDELNVKEVIFGADIQNDIELDMNITPELKKEGQLRELVRSIQDLRKKEELLPSQKVDIIVHTAREEKDFVELFGAELKKAAALNMIIFGETEGEKINIDGLEFVVKIKK